MKIQRLKIRLLGIILVALGTSCTEQNAISYTDYVNVFIGTGGHGHTFPGATYPHGMVQLSPDTRLSGWDACAGYYYDDNHIHGFTHTHLNGTGRGDYGDILFMPVVSTAIWEKKDTVPVFRILMRALVRVIIRCYLKMIQSM